MIGQSFGQSFGVCIFARVFFRWGVIASRGFKNQNTRSLDIVKKYARQGDSFCVSCMRIFTVEKCFVPFSIDQYIDGIEYEYFVQN